MPFENAVNNILRVLLAAVAASLFFAWIAPALAQPPAARGDPDAYASLRWIAPTAGATVHDNAGDVEVVVALDPALRSSAGHRLAVALDGALLPLRSTSPRFVVGDIDRGEHRLRVLVVAADGKSLIRSDERTIYVWRASRLFPSRR